MAAFKSFGDSVLAFWNAQADWSRETFGSDQERGPIGPLKHLEKEAKEAYDETDPTKQRMEIVDCQFLVFDAARRSGMTIGELFGKAWQKLEINKARKWSKPTSDEPVEHVRDCTEDPIAEQAINAHIFGE